jgi:hypothetical protein
VFNLCRLIWVGPLTVISAVAVVRVIQAGTMVAFGMPPAGEEPAVLTAFFVTIASSSCRVAFGSFPLQTGTKSFPRVSKPS